MIFVFVKIQIPTKWCSGSSEKKLKITGPVCKILNNFYAVLVLDSSKSGIHDFCHVYIWLVN